ncbi:MAG TPA: hypothetical protein VMT16_09170, partial [Thermoanaerobaculia bacterium]|nr:hypothetical protein [Thermoanaerobaculia bacterium]
MRFFTASPATARAPHALAHPAGGWSSTGLWLLVAAGVAAKTWSIWRFLPSIWLWLDELFYFATAFDFVHWGASGVPHPGFLFYPPLTSLVIAPLHLVGLAPPQVYFSSLVLLNTLLTASMVFGGHLIYLELFGQRSVLLPAFLVFAAPAYSGLMLMSEPVFVSLFVWMSYFFIRAFAHGHARDFVLCGSCAALLPLTRDIGILVIPALLLLSPLQLSRARRQSRSLQAIGKVTMLWAIPVMVLAVWRPLEPSGAVAAHGATRAAGLMERVWATLQPSPELVLVVLRNFLTGLTYISFTTLGVCLPIVLWLVARRRADPIVRLTALQLVALMVAISAAVAIFMFPGRAHPLP